MKKRYLIGAAAVAALLVGLTGCSGTGSGSTPSSTSQLTYGLLIKPNSFEASQTEWGVDALFMQATYDTLLTTTPRNEIQPGLATAWKYNDDRTQLTLTIRSGVTFDDGTKLTPAIVVKNLLNFRDAGGPNSSHLANVTGATAEGDTVVISLNQPNPALLLYLAQTAGLIENPASFHAKTASTTPDGTGPYTLDQRDTVPGTVYTFVKKKKYWDAKDQHFDKLVFKIFTDPAALTNATLGHQVDVASTAAMSKVDNLEAAGYKAKWNEFNWIGLSMFDRGGAIAPALKDVRVRQAINYALDRKSLLKGLADGNGTVTTQVFPDYSPGYDKSLDAKYPYDPAKAKQLLAEAGYKDGFTVTMPTTTLLPTASFAVVQQQLAEVGIKVQLQDANTTFISDVLAAKYPLVFMPLQQNTDWELYNFMLAPKATFNPFHTDDPTLTGLSTTVRDGDPKTAAAAAKKMDQYVVDQAWFAPFYRLPKAIMVDPKKVDLTVQQGNVFPNLREIVPVG
jgi:peptide/nickel transport system substrate-binding protein